MITFGFLLWLQLLSYSFILLVITLMDQKMTEQRKLCKDCLHYRESWLGHLFGNNSLDRCYNPIVTGDLITGDKKSQTPKQAQQVRDLLAPNSKPTPNSSQIGSSLVGRVALAISRCEDSSAWDDEAVNWKPEARAAIREVALWLNEASLDLYPGDRSIVVNALYDQANQ